MLLKATINHFDSVSGRSRGLLVFAKSHLPTRQLAKLKIPMDIWIEISQLSLRKKQMASGISF